MVINKNNDSRLLIVALSHYFYSLFMEGWVRKMDGNSVRDEIKDGINEVLENYGVDVSMFKNGDLTYSIADRIFDVLNIDETYQDTDYSKLTQDIESGSMNPHLTLTLGGSD